LVLQACVGSHACYSVCVIKLPNEGKNGDLPAFGAGERCCWLLAGILEFPLLFFCLLLLFSFLFFWFVFIFSQVDLLSFSLPCYSFPCFLLPLFSFFSFSSLLFFFPSSMPLPFIGILSCCLSCMIVIRPGILCFGRIGTPTVVPSLDCWWWFPPRLNGLLWRRRTRKRTEKRVMVVVGIAMWLVAWVACLGGILYFLRRWSPPFPEEEDEEWNKTAPFLTGAALLQFSHFMVWHLLIRLLDFGAVYKTVLGFQFNQFSP